MLSRPILALPYVMRATLRASPAFSLAPRATAVSSRAAALPRFYATVPTADADASTEEAEAPQVMKETKRKGKRALKPWVALGPDGKKLPLPQDTKPSLNAPYLIYFKQRLSELKSSPELQKISPRTGQSIIDVIKLTKSVAQEWKSLSDSDKAAVQQEYESQKSTYEAAMADWRKSLTADDYRRQASYNLHQRKKGAHVQLRLRDPTMPVRLRTGYTVFVEEQRSKEDLSNTPLEDWEKTQAEKWEQLSADQKADYERASSADRSNYKDKLAEYKAKLV